MDSQTAQKIRALVARIGRSFEQQGYTLFDEFISCIRNIPNTQLAVVSANSNITVVPKTRTSGLPFTHILCYEDNPSKEKKIEHVCHDWDVSVQDVYYFTDTLADVYELETLLDRTKIIGCAWGHVGYDLLATALPAKQILRRYEDIYTLLQ